MSELKVNRRKVVRSTLAIVLLTSALGVAVGLLGLVLAQTTVVRSLSAIAVVGAWVLPILCVVRYWAALNLLKPALKAEELQQTQNTVVATVQQTQKTVVAAVEDARAKTSRHEYHQELALTRLENEMRRVAVLSTGMQPRTEAAAYSDILFVTSNGAGLGHVSRLLAVAEKLPETRRFELLTLSKAFKQIAIPGLTVHYFPSSEATGESPQRWNRVFQDYFRNLVGERRPRIVVFDGTWVYTGLTDVCRALSIPLVWMQRGMWKPEVDQASTQRHDVARVADHLIIPGDYSGAESVDAGSGINAHYVGPVVRTAAEDLLPREDACASLGLDPTNRYVLLNLGGGLVSDPGSLAAAALKLIQEIAPGLTSVQVVSPLVAKRDNLPGLVQITAYPVMPCARAFDFMVAAAGYNSAQEAVSLAIPTVLIPNRNTKTDDQLRRAQQLAEKGLVLMAEGHTGLEEALRRISDPVVRDSLVSKLELIEPIQGAQQAAEIVDRILTAADWPMLAETIDGSLLHLASEKS